METKKHHSKLKKKTVAGAAGILAGLSVIVSGLVNMDDDFLRGGDYDEKVQSAGNVTKVDRVPSDIRQIPIIEKYGAFDRVKLWFWKLPLVVKVLVIGPVWIIGKIITWLAALAIHAVSPFWGVIIGVLIHAALLFALFAGTNAAEFIERLVALWSLDSIGIWLYRTADKVISRYIKKNFRDKSLDELEIDVEDKSAFVSRSYEIIDIYMTKDELTILEDYYLKGEKIKQIAEKNGISEAALYKRIERLKAKLEKHREELL